MARELSETSSITPYSDTRAGADQRCEVKLAQNSATNGETTQIAISTTRSWEGLRLVARSKNPTEPTAPATTAIEAAVRIPENPPGLGIIPLRFTRQETCSNHRR